MPSKPKPTIAAYRKKRYPPRRRYPHRRPAATAKFPPRKTYAPRKALVAKRQPYKSAKASILSAALFTEEYRKHGHGSTLRNMGPVQPIAQRYLMKFRYHEQLTLTLSAGVPNDYQYRLNSLADPNRTGTGHQPYGHDTIATLYSQYRVYETHWRIRVDPAVTTTANQQSTSVTIHPENGNSAYSNQELVGELPRAITKSVVNGIKSADFVGKQYLPALSGETKTAYMGNDLNSSTFNGSPQTNMTLHIFSECTSTQVINVTVDLVFYTECFDPIPLSSSVKSPDTDQYYFPEEEKKMISAPRLPTPRPSISQQIRVPSRK